MNDEAIGTTGFQRAAAWFDWACGRVDAAVRLALILFASLIFALLILQVVMRYVIRTPLVWVEELSSYTLAFMVLWGAACLVRGWEHVRVETFYAMLPALLRKVIAVGLNLLLIYVGYLLLTSGHRLAMLGAADLSDSGYFNLFWPRQAMTTGAALIMLQAFNNILGVFAGRAGRLVEGN